MSFFPGKDPAAGDKFAHIHVRNPYRAIERVAS